MKKVFYIYLIFKRNKIKKNNKCRIYKDKNS